MFVRMQCIGLLTLGSKFKARAANKINIYVIQFVLGWVVNMVGKGENADYQYFLVFPQSFEELSVLGVVGNSKE